MVDAETTRPCFCVEHPHRYLQTDRPSSYPELRIEAEIPGHAPTWHLQCTVCGTRWQVHAIPYGGIYGDFDWQRVSA